MTTAPPIVLTTDFGLTDPYVGMMKGVIQGINAQATILDLTHQIQPQNLRQASFILANSYKYFPEGTVHVAVVDPGVGTGRNALLLESPSARFVAPDNGLLSGVLADFMADLPQSAETVSVPSGCAAFRLTNPDYWLRPVSSTFHGRDIFAPTAAHLSLGVEPTALGEPLRELVWLAPARVLREGNRITGEVVYADHFGNLITNVPQSMLAELVEVKIGGYRIVGLSHTFHDSNAAKDQPLALIGSNGYLEIALPDGSAASTLGVGAGAVLNVTTSTTD